jgi:hypothetical protein
MNECFPYHEKSNRQLLEHLVHLGEKIMASIAEVQAALGTATTAVTGIGTDVSQIKTDSDAILAKLVALQTAGGGINPTDLDPIVAALQALSSNAGAIDANAKTVSAALEAASSTPVVGGTALQDVGGVNVVKTVSVPPVTVPLAIGATASVVIAITNTGPVTYDPGTGPLPVLSGAGSPLVGGELVAGATIVFTAIASGFSIPAPVALRRR